MMYILELVAQNGDKLVRYDEAKVNKKYMSVFDYSEKHGGTFDSVKYYNDYFIELGGKNE